MSLGQDPTALPPFPAPGPVAPPVGAPELGFTAPPLPTQGAIPPDSLLGVLSDPSAARANPNRMWQSATPTLPKLTFSDIPSDEETRKVGVVLDLFRKARDARKPLYSRWVQNYYMMVNRYWAGMRRKRPDWLPAPEVAEIMPIAATISGWLTDQRPTPTCSPSALPHDAFSEMFNAMADDLEYTLQASYAANLEEREIKKAAWDSIVYGTSIFKTYWDSWLAGGLGDATFCQVSPFNFYPDPQARSTEDGNYYIEARRMSLQELDRRYPGSYELFNKSRLGAGGLTDLDEAPSHSDMSATGGTTSGPTPAALSPSTTPNTSRPGSGRMDDDYDPTVTVLECWVREHEIVPVVDARTGEETERASDEWRLLVVANERLIMECSAFDLWDHGRHPYDRMPYIEMGEFWSLSLVEFLVSPQKAMNRILAALQHNIELTGNPILKQPKGMRTQLVNRPGQTLPVGRGQADETGWLEPPALNVAMVQILEYYLKRMEAISGMSAVVKGNTPSGRNAQGVVDAVQEAAFVRIRDVLRNMEWALAGVFRKKADLIVSNYTTPRIVSIAGPRSERSSRALKGGHFLIPTLDGRVPFAYQIIVDAGARSHTARSMREDRAIQLFTVGAIDEQALLADIEYPNAAEVSSRVEQKRAAAAMAEPGARQRTRA